MTILLAEDSAFYRRMIANHLKEWGFDFVTAQDGKQAWKLLAAKDAPRLALLDWVLPEIEGIELCRRLRSRSEFQAPCCSKGSRLYARPSSDHEQHAGCARRRSTTVC